MVVVSRIWRFVVTKTIEILLSVYKPDWVYLKQQLTSIFEQKSVSVKISVRDDTGTEQHLKELKSFLKDNFKEQNNITILSGKNLGPAYSFLELCYQSDVSSDYFAFCDQDDVWEHDKIIHSIKCMENVGAGLYASTLNVTDENLVVKYQTSKPQKISFQNSLTENVITGCTMVFDREVMDLVRSCQPEFITMHDHWLYMIASFHSQIYYDQLPYIKYRQHGANVVGERSVKYYLNKFVGFVSGAIRNKKRISDQAASFYDCYSGQLKEEHKKEIEMFLDMKGKFILRVFNINRYSRNGIFENLIFKIKFLLGLY